MLATRSSVSPAVFVANGGQSVRVGSESDGLGADWERLLDEKVKIPMWGISDSLNVNVAAAIFLYEALRSKNA